MDNLREHVRCDLCGSEDDYDIVYEADKYRIMHEETLDEKFKSSSGEVLLDQVVKCKHCNLVYVNPRIRSDLIFKGYSDGEDPDFASQSMGRQITSERCLKHIEKFTGKERGALLDVGTGDSSLPYVAKKMGWSVSACEPNSYLCGWAKNNLDIDTTQGDIFQQNYESESKDLICLFDVIEHVTEPSKVLAECNRIMKPEGILAVNIPDISSWLARLLGRRYPFWLSVHLTYYTKETIRNTLEKAGFEVISVSPHWQSLSLGYLVQRMEAYSKLLSRLGKIFVKLTFTKNLQIRYWLGQTMIIAKKV